MSNRLADELSPYLLQHADNPVDWYPWGDEAFARARAESKPIFLSIGYSTCHWCHVMEHESFENRHVADLLNRHFVAIKVDREERPDVDRVYMAFVQAATGAGGWPMSVWLTPELKPFFGGTYLPPSARWGRPGFTEILQETARLWADERPRLIESAESLMARLSDRQRGASVGGGGVGVSVARAETLGQGVDQFVQAFDAEHGGFGDAPKFPRPSELLFLLREHVRTGGRQALTMVQETLRAMADGGMRDHVGGGFHRYSVDAEWRVPHFEKMLYDQAQLTLAYLEAGQLTGDPSFLDSAADTLAYVARDLGDSDGGFFSAEDADSEVSDPSTDSPKTKSEGAFYLWTQKEVDDLLHDDAEVVRCRYGVEPNGNAPHDPLGELRGKNQLYVARSIDEVAHLTDQPAEAVKTTLSRARPVLFDARSRRPRPHLDDKILTAWNGLMIAALARAAHVFERDSDGTTGAATSGEARGVAALGRAKRAAVFIRETLWDPERRVLHRRYRDGQASIDGYCEDYAFLVWGLLELFQVSGDVTWLRWARELHARQDELFWDQEDGGWFSTTGQDPSVLLRMKEDYDGAEPSAGSVSAMNLLTLVHLTGDSELGSKLDLALARFGPRLGQAARAVPLLTAALSHYWARTSQIVVVGVGGRADTRALRRCVAEHYLPFAVRVNVEPGAMQETLGRSLPFVASMTMLSGRATAYVCSDFACQEPVSDPAVLGAALAELGSVKR